MSPRIGGKDKKDETCLIQGQVPPLPLAPLPLFYSISMVLQTTKMSVKLPLAPHTGETTPSNQSTQIIYSPSVAVVPFSVSFSLFPVADFREVRSKASVKQEE